MTQLHDALTVSPPRGNSRPALQTPRLSVVVVNYCQWENTAALVRQVRAAPCTRRGEVEVVIVDNHSPRHRLIAKLRRRPGVSVRRWGRNRGFARAVNEGCRLSQGQWFLILNPDISLSADFIQGVLDLAAELEAHDPRAGIIGFQLHNRDGSEQLSAGFFPTLASTLARLVLPRTRRKYHALKVRGRCRVPWVTGCCLLIRRDCFQDLGGMDERFFLYYEDVDLCRRARAQGWNVYFEPNLHAVHHNPLHGRAVPHHLRLVTRHALLTYSARHWPGWQCRLLAGIVRLEATCRRFWAWWRKDQPAATIYRNLDAIAGELVANDSRTARKRVERVMKSVRCVAQSSERSARTSTVARSAPKTARRG